MQIAVELYGFDIKSFGKFFFVKLNEFIAQRLGHLCLDLVEQRNHIVLQRSFSSALEINEIRFAVFHHDVARLEIAVHEEIVGRRADKIGEGVEIVVQARFIENDFLMWLDEIIFEIIQVVDDGLSVETCFISIFLNS